MEVGGWTSPTWWASRPVPSSAAIIAALTRGLSRRRRRQRGPGAAGADRPASAFSVASWLATNTRRRSSDVSALTLHLLPALLTPPDDAGLRAAGCNLGR